MTNFIKVFMLTLVSLIAGIARGFYFHNVIIVGALGWVAMIARVIWNRSSVVDIIAFPFTIGLVVMYITSHELNLWIYIENLFGGW